MRYLISGRFEDFDLALSEEPHGNEALQVVGQTHVNTHISQAMNDVEVPITLPHELLSWFINLIERSA